LILSEDFICGADTLAFDCGNYLVAFKEAVAAEFVRRNQALLDILMEGPERDGYNGRSLSCMQERRCPIE